MWTLLGLDPFRRAMFLRGLVIVSLTVLGSKIDLGASVTLGLAATLWATWEIGRRADPLRRSVTRLALESDREATLDIKAGLRTMAETVGRARTQLDDSRRRAERERDDVRGILEATTNGILVIGHGNKVQLINDAARRLLQLATDPLDEPLSQIVPNRSILSFAAELREGGHPAPVRLTVGSDEDERFLRLSGSVIQGTRLRQRVVLVFHDITDLEHLQQVRTDFVANVTHEMRSPLASILGYAETLSETEDLTDEERGDALKRILRNARRLDDIIRDLIELSRLEHTTKPETSPTKVEDLVKGCVGAFEDLASEKGIQLVVDVESVQGLLELDGALVHQALTNLVENAVKYTPSGGSVRVKARFVDAQHPAHQLGQPASLPASHSAGQLLGHGDADAPFRTLELSVSDTGPGIPLELQGRVFERFYRVDTARSRALGGTGLGLAIVKHAAAVHGGTVLLESQPDEGTTFRLRLPLGKELAG